MDLFVNTVCLFGTVGFLFSFIKGQVDINTKDDKFDKWFIGLLCFTVILDLLIKILKDLV